MRTRVEMLKEMGVSSSDAEQYIDDLEKLLPKYGVAESKLRLAHFFAQVLHESGCMRFDAENLNYSSGRCSASSRSIFGRRIRPTLTPATLRRSRTAFTRIEWATATRPVVTGGSTAAAG